MTHEHAQAIFDATPQPKTLQWFDADHGLATKPREQPLRLAGARPRRGPQAVLKRNACA